MARQYSALGTRGEGSSVNRRALLLAALAARQGPGGRGGGQRPKSRGGAEGLLSQIPNLLERRDFARRLLDEKARAGPERRGLAREEMEMRAQQGERSGDLAEDRLGLQSRTLEEQMRAAFSNEGLAQDRFGLAQQTFGLAEQGLEEQRRSAMASEENVRYGIDNPRPRPQTELQDRTLDLLNRDAKSAEVDEAADRAVLEIDPDEALNVFMNAAKPTGNPMNFVSYIRRQIGDDPELVRAVIKKMIFTFKEKLQGGTFPSGRGPTSPYESQFGGQGTAGQLDPANYQQMSPEQQSARLRREIAAGFQGR